MDQLGVAHGTPGALLPIWCRPDVLGEPVPLPEGVTAVGWPSGVKHAVSGSPYGTARTAAFMGKKILESRLARRLEHTAESVTVAGLRPKPHSARHALGRRIPDPLRRRR